MSGNRVTRNQHYVQRKYLSEWTDDLTTTGFAIVEIDGKTPKPIRITNVLFEKDFYKLPILSFDEIEACKAILSALPFVSEKTTDDYIYNLRVTKKVGEARNQKDLKDFEKVLIQVGEGFQTIAEGMMDDALRNKILSRDSSFLNLQEERYSFLAYVFMQYLRTPRVKSIISKNIDDYVKKENMTGVSGENIWAVIHGAIASDAAHSFFQKRDLTVQFLVSKKKDLITCDCPVVRLEPARDGFDRFYYPFSPGLAIIISTNREETGVQLLNDLEVSYYNELIRKNAERIIVYKNRKQQ